MMTFSVHDEKNYDNSNLTADIAKKLSEWGCQRKLEGEWIEVCERIYNSTHAGCYSATFINTYSENTIERLKDAGFKISFERGFLTVSWEEEEE